jgi:hypothetical protein
VLTFPAAALAAALAYSILKVLLRLP